MDQEVTKAGTLVELDADGNEATILDSGFAVAGSPTPAGPMPKVDSLSATPGDQEGEADLNWHPVLNNHGYIIQSTTDPNTPASWKQVANSSASKTTVSGLTSGTKYWFRVAALGTNGKPCPFSDPATAIAS